MRLSRNANTVGFRPRLVEAIVLPLVLMMVLAGLLTWQIERLLGAAASDAHSQDVVAQADGTLNLILDTETELRGYLLTGDGNFLKRYETSRTAIGPSLDELQRLVAGRPAQTQRLEGIRSAYQAWEKHSGAMVQLRAAGNGGDQSTAMLHGKRLTDEVRARMGVLVQNELALHDARNVAVQKAARGAVRSVLVLSLLVAAAFVAFTIRQLIVLSRSYRRAESDVQEKAQAVEDTEGRFRAIFENAAVGIAQAGSDGRWRRVNRRFCEITGYSREELVEKTWRELTFAEDVDRELEQRRRIEVGEIESYSSEKRYICRDGSLVWVSISVSVVRTDTGKPKYFISVVEDISLRKLAEAAQRASEARLQLALDASHMGSWEWDVKTGRVRMSDYLLELLGTSSDKFGGRYEDLIALVHPDDRSSMREAARRAIEGKAPYRSEYRVVRPDGKISWMMGRGDVVRDVAGAPMGLVGVTMDITDRKHAEQERAELLRREQKARAEAEAANQRKDHFLAVLSHELRTPLTPVMARLALLKRDPALPPDARSALEMIRRNVELEARLIDDLLDITRIARGQLHLNFTSVDAHDKIRNALEIYESEIAARKLNVSLELGAEEHHVRADPARLQQIFWNLISNSVKYTMAGGEIAIRSRNSFDSSILGDETATQEHRQPALIVEVRDNGIGIEPEVMERLFDPFEQGEQTLTRRYGGLGLGLSISRTLVRMHGGRITAASAGPGKGATFTVELKTVSAAAVEEAPQPVEPVAPRRPLRILLVEDNEDTLRVLARLLRIHGYSVKPAASMKAALDAAASDGFDLVISDIGLPDGSGWELMRELRSRGPMKGIALSGFSMDEDIQKSRSAGFFEHLAKPINPEELEEAIQRVARREAEVIQAGGS